MRRPIVLLVLPLVAATALAAPAEAADDLCLRAQPMQSYGGDPEPATLTTVALRVPVEIQADPSCEGMTITVQRPDGSQRVIVPLTEKVHNEWPTIDTRTGFLAVPLATGAGQWVMTKVTHGANEIVTNVSFRVTRGATLTLEQPARTSGSAKTVVTGVARRYSPAGVLLPASGVSLRIMNSSTVLATARTDANGRYTAQLALRQATELTARMPATGDYIDVATAP